MENYSVVLLKNNLVVKAFNFEGVENLTFTRDGKVDSFTYSGTDYYAVYYYNTSKFIDYVNKNIFELLKKQQKEEAKNKNKPYEGVGISLWKNPEKKIDYTFQHYSKLVTADEGDYIYGKLRDNNSGLCFNYFKWLYNLPYSVPINPVLVDPNKPPFDCEVLADGSHAKKFYDDFKDEPFYDIETGQNVVDRKLVAEIASLLNEAGEKTAIAFGNFVLSDVDSQEFKMENLSRQTLLIYKKSLETWLKFLNEYQTEMSKLEDDDKLYIYIDVMYRYNMLEALSVEKKIKLLKIFFEIGQLINWYWTNPKIGFVNKEDLAIYILKSVTNNSDADLFLQKLISTKILIPMPKNWQGMVVTKYKTLYKMLFSRMDDYGGKDNFTAFIKELEKIVLLRNNISLSTTPMYSISELEEITEAQFIWREKGKMKDRVKYEILSYTPSKIKFKETINIKTQLVPKYTYVDIGTPIQDGYEERVIDTDVREFELNHFDLISIHFYDNPSFIDLSTDISYVGKNYLTFAGFVDYILEKEDTAFIEDIFNAGLFLISLVVGIGELTAAIRSVNAARAILGLGMITSDTAAYLVGTTQFKNYIITTYGNEKGNEILGNLTILTTIAALGTNAIAGSGILKAYTREQGLKLVGTGEALLKDTNALNKLNPDEIIALKNAIKSIKNELYAIRNVPEAVETIKNTKADVLFFKFPGLRSALDELSEFERLAFRTKFVNLSEREVNALQSRWIGSTFATKQEIILNSETWIKNIKLEQYLKDGRYDLISILYNKPITEGYLHNGVRYAMTTADATAETLAELNKANIIANRTDDVAIIANNCGYPEHVIQKVKNHFFKNEYLLDRGDGTLCLGRLTKEPSPSINSFGDSDLWNHFINTPYDQITDIRKAEFRWLIAHEYIEAGLMEKHMPLRSFINGDNALSYDVGAHYLSVNKTGVMYEFAPYTTLGRLQINIPPLPNQNLDNLDNILNQLITFYKLE
jgi:hypothetical protein